RSSRLAARASARFGERCYAQEGIGASSALITDGNEDTAINNGSGAHQLPRGAVRRARWIRERLLRRRLGNLWSRQHRGHWPGAAATISTSLLSRSQRTGDGSYINCLREDEQSNAHFCMNVFDRTGRYEHDHRRGYRNDQSNPSVVASG